MKHLTTGLILAILITSAGGAIAGGIVFPDPTFSHCPPQVHLGDGSCCDTFLVRDQFNNPIDLANVTLDFGLCPTLVLSPSQGPGLVVSGNTISGTTNAAGRIIFCAVGSGACAGSVKITGNTILIRSYPGATSCQHTTPSSLASWGRVRRIYR